MRTSLAARESELAEARARAERGDALLREAGEKLQTIPAMEGELRLAARREALSEGGEEELQRTRVALLGASVDLRSCRETTEGLTRELEEARAAAAASKLQVSVFSPVPTGGPFDEHLILDTQMGASRCLRRKALASSLQSSAEKEAVRGCLHHAHHHTTYRTTRHRVRTPPHRTITCHAMPRTPQSKLQISPSPRHTTHATHHTPHSTRHTTSTKSDHTPHTKHFAPHHSPHNVHTPHHTMHTTPHHIHRSHALYVGPHTPDLPPCTAVCGS